MKVYILIGLPGSGKSTWSANFVKEHDDTIIISRDFFRTMIKGQYVFDVKYEHLIFDMNNECIKIALENNFNVIVDETNLTYKRRMSIISLIRDYENKLKNKIEVIYVWLTETERNLNFRMQNHRNLSEEKWKTVIDDMKKIYQAPREEEGFDSLLKINPLEAIQ